MPLSAQGSGQSGLLCTHRPASECEGCSIQHRLNCRFDPGDLLSFFMLILPFGVTMVVGVMRAGYGGSLFLWLLYMLLFFFVWEARVLCSHCPYWAEEGRVLHCPANYGVIKMWPYRPEPMSRLERVQFAMGGLLWMAFPFVFLLIGGEYLLAGIGLATIVSGAYGLWKHTCGRCINFSCPMNHVPRDVVDTYLARNPTMRAAWEAHGYRLNG